MKQWVKIVGAFIIFMLGAKMVQANQFLRKGKFETKYTTIHFDDIQQVYDMAENLADGIKEFFTKVSGNQDLIRERIDRVVEEAAKLVGTDLGNFHVNIELTQSQAETRQKFVEGNGDVKLAMGVSAFYNPNKLVVVVSNDKVERGVLRHEMTHAIEHIVLGTSTGELRATRALFS